MSFLSSFMPIKSMTAHALDMVERLTEQPDSPQGDWVPSDLKNEMPTFEKMASGDQLLTSLLLKQDLKEGSESAALPLFLALISMTGIALPLVAHWFGAVIAISATVLLVLPLLYICKSLLGVMNTFWVAALSLAMPLFGLAAAHWLKYSVIDDSVFLIAAVFITIAVFVFGRLIGEHKTTAKWVVLYFWTLIATAFSPPILQRVIVFAPAILVPVLYAFRLNKARGLALLAQSFEYQGELAGANSSQHRPKLLEQAKNAAADKSTLIRMGSATQTFYDRGDKFAPLERQEMVYSVNDLFNTHLLIFGASGEGKTNTMQQQIIQLIKSGEVGGLYGDGKGDMASKFLGLKNGTTVRPGLVSLGLYEGLSSSEVMQTLLDISQEGKDGGGGAKDPMWNNQAMSMGQTALEILRGLATAEKAKLIQQGFKGAELEDRREWRVDMSTHDRFTNLLMMGTKAVDADPSDVVDARRDEIFELIEGTLPSAKDKTSTLFDSIRWWREEFPNIPGVTRGGIYTNLQSMLKPILMSDHPGIRDWSRTESGFDVLACLKGHHVFIDLPETIYARAGGLIYGLLNKRVNKAIKQRAGRDWKAEGDLPMVKVVDECQVAGMLSEDDISLIAMGRSLGCAFILGTQDIEKYRRRFGDRKAEDLLATAKGTITLPSSHQTYEWLFKKLPTTARSFSRVHNAESINYLQSVTQSLSSPLYDPSHPNAAFYKRLRREGYGNTEYFSMPNAKGGMDLTRASELTATDLERRLDVRVLRQIGEPRPIVGHDDLNARLSRGVAVVSVMRGGHPRRDIVKLDEFKGVPAELLDPNFVVPEPKNIAPDEDFLAGLERDHAGVAPLADAEHVERVKEIIASLKTGASLSEISWVTKDDTDWDEAVSDAAKLAVSDELCESFAIEALNEELR